MNEIKEGHGETDISCPCGSRWIWFPTTAKWVQVVLAPKCFCGKPPKPFIEKGGESTVSGKRSLENSSEVKECGLPVELKPEMKRFCKECGVELIFDELNGWFCPNGLCDMGYDVNPPEKEESG